MGILRGFDRVRIRGTKRLMCHAGRLAAYLWHQHVPLKDFGQHAEQTSQRIKEATQQLAKDAELSVEYLSAPGIDKDQAARRIAKRHGITQGLAAVLSAVEPCWSFEIHRDRASKRIDLRRAFRKCLHYYHYFLHPQLGWMNVRFQTWLPFSLQICINGREWLCRQMDLRQLAYRRRDNCLVWVQDLDQAQALLEEQLHTDWPRLLDGLVPQVSPLDDQLYPVGYPVPYYWSVDQSEWASDYLFRRSEDMARVYPRLIEWGITSLGSRDVLRFLGRKVPAEGYGRFTGEVVTDLRERPEGLRIKHWVNRNSIKMYDKQDTVLRVETTVSNARDIKVYRPKEGEPDGPKDWRILRKGLADLHRLAQASQQANDRYVQALAGVDLSLRVGEVGQELARRVKWKGRTVRGLNPLAPGDVNLLEAVNGGQFVLHGFRNADIREALYGPAPADRQESRRQSSAVTRKLRLLRAHGLIRKLPHTRRYLVSDKGRSQIGLLLLARQANAAKLAPAA
jgi:hypothetical protein